MRASTSFRFSSPVAASRFIRISSGGQRAPGNQHGMAMVGRFGSFLHDVVAGPILSEGGRGSAQGGGEAE